MFCSVVPSRAAAVRNRSLRSPEVADHRREVVAVVGLVAESVPPLIERDHPPAPRQLGRHEVPDATIRRQSVKEHDRRTVAAVEPSQRRACDRRALDAKRRREIGEDAGFDGPGRDQIVLAAHARHRFFLATTRS